MERVIFILKGYRVAMDPISWLLINLYGLLAGGIQLFIPFLLATLVLTLVFNFVKKKTGWKWVGSASFTLIASFTLFFFLLNVYFILGGSAQTDVTQVPEDIRASPMWVQSQSNVFFLLSVPFPNRYLPGSFLGCFCSHSLSSEQRYLIHSRKGSRVSGCDLG